MLQLNSRLSSALAQQAASTTKVNDQKACVTSDMQALEQERQSESHGVLKFAPHPIHL